MQTERYQSYLLRLWRDTETGPWRASLQNIANREQVFFSTLEELFGYLCTRTKADIYPIWEINPPKQEPNKENLL